MFFVSTFYHCIQSKLIYTVVTLSVISALWAIDNCALPRQWSPRTTVFYQLYVVSNVWRIKSNQTCCKTELLYFVICLLMGEKILREHVMKYFSSYIA